jgi:hypothetical protein
MMGTVCVPCGFLVGLHLAYTAPGDYSRFPYYSSCAAFLAAALAWRVVAERGPLLSRASAVAAGAIGVILAHHLTWYFVVLVSNVEYWVLQRQVGSLSEAPLDPLLGFFAVTVLTLFSLVAYGWITLPYGMVAGYLLVRLNEARQRLDP